MQSSSKLACVTTNCFNCLFIMVYVLVLTIAGASKSFWGRMRHEKAQPCKHVELQVHICKGFIIFQVAQNYDNNRSNQSVTYLVMWNYGTLQLRIMGQNSSSIFTFRLCPSVRPQASHPTFSPLNGVLDRTNQIFSESL